MLVMDAVVADGMILLVGKSESFVCIELHLPLPLPLSKSAQILLEYDLAGLKSA